MWRALLLVAAIASPASADYLLAYGRVAMDLPEGMIRVPNPAHGDHTYPGWATARAELRVDGETIVIATVAESYATAGRDLAKDVRAELELQGIAFTDVATLELADGARGVAVTPVPPRTTEGTHLIHAVYATSGEDAAVVIVAFYARGVALDHLSRWTNIARSAAATLRVSPAGAQRRDAILRLASTDLEIPIVTGWRAIPLHGRFGAAIELRKEVKLGERASTCVIERGATAPATERRRRAARVLGAPARWHVWRRKSVINAHLAFELAGEAMRAICTLRHPRDLRAARVMLQGTRAHVDKGKR